MSADAILTTEDDGVLHITLNRPDARNAVNGAIMEGMVAALERLDADDGLRIGIVSGAGGTFCAGMDLKAFVAGESAWHPERGFAGIAMRAADKPLIAAIEGFAVAGGFEVALACDMIVAARGAKLGIPEAKRGLVAAAGGVFRLPQRLPYHVAMEMALTGDPISAERGHELGIVNRLAEPGGAVDAARGLAAAIVRNAPLSISASKAVVQRAREWSDAEAWENQGPYVSRALTSQDAQEGARAFAEKREPRWSGQ